MPPRPSLASRRRWSRSAACPTRSWASPGSPRRGRRRRCRHDVLPGGVRHQDRRGVHGDHGGRGAAHARRAAYLRVDAGPPRPEPGGPPGVAPAGGRRPQESREGGNASGPGGQGALHARPGHVVRPGAAHVRGDPVRGAAPHAVGRRGHGGGQSARGIPVHPGLRIARRVRHRAGRMVVEQQVLPAGGVARQRADDLLRDRDGHEHGRRLLIAGNVTLGDVIAKQSQSLFTWNVFPLSLAYFIFIVAAFAATNRLPFDLPEAEAELIAGYHTEYSAMKFSMFYIAEYANMVTASALMTTLFFGGWDI